MVAAVCAGAIPIPWAIATFYLSRLAYSWMTRGLTPGDIRFNHAWTEINRWAEVGYFTALPLLVVGLAISAAAFARIRWRSPWGLSIAVGAITVVLGGLAWCVGFVGLAATIWNE